MSLSVSKKLTETVMSWAGVTLGTHRFGGIAFFLSGKEIAHLHGEHHLDIPFSKSMRDELVAAGRAKPHHILPNSSWVTVYIRSETDFINAVELLRMKYEDLAAQKS